MTVDSAPRDVIRSLALTQELETSVALMQRGFRALQEIDMGNDFYHLPHQLLASGVERFMKCYICLVHKGAHGQYPEIRKTFGHDLVKLFDHITEHCFSVRTPALKEDSELITADPNLRRILVILTDFGKLGRYHNLDVVAGVEKDRIDPRQNWENLESELLDPTPYLSDARRMYDDYYPKLNALIVGRIEGLLRGIARQFTLGGHRDPEGALDRMWPVVSSLALLRDLGTTDYRPSIESQRRSPCVWEKEPRRRFGKHPARIVRPEQFGGEWPFRFDKVKVECRERIFAIVYVEGYAFGLNGAARSRFNYPDPHEAGVAILGRSIGPFIDMALALAKPP